MNRAVDWGVSYQRNTQETLCILKCDNDASMQDTLCQHVGPLTDFRFTQTMWKVDIIKRTVTLTFTLKLNMPKSYLLDEPRKFCLKSLKMRVTNELKGLTPQVADWVGEQELEIDLMKDIVGWSDGYQEYMVGNNTFLAWKLKGCSVFSFASDSGKKTKGKRQAGGNTQQK